MASTLEDQLLCGPTTTYGTMKTSSDSRDNDHVATAEGSLVVPPKYQKEESGLHRGLSARQVQMIAIGGTIGTGLFLGTGRSLAQGGPASILICYAIIGFIVYVALLLLGEMATQYPVTGESQAHVDSNE
jgi:AAT family amino acid transporter